MRYEIGDDFLFDATTNKLFEKGVDVELSGTQMQIVRLLAEKAPDPVSTSDMLAAVWGTTTVTGGNVKSQIDRIRKKIPTKYLATVPGGKGYAMLEVRRERSTFPSLPPVKPEIFAFLKAKRLEQTIYPIDEYLPIYQNYYPGLTRAEVTIDPLGEYKPPKEIEGVMPRFPVEGPDNVNWSFAG